MELKTLKDLKHLVEREEGIPDYEAIDLFSLKQEAIKWVKEMNKLETADDMIYEKDWEKIFKDFHNITEEDLK